MHEHKECEHELEYCKICDTVYCEKCKKEWKKPATFQAWYNANQTIGDGTVITPLNIDGHIHMS